MTMASDEDSAGSAEAELDALAVQVGPASPSLRLLRSLAFLCGLFNAPVDRTPQRHPALLEATGGQEGSTGLVGEVVDNAPVSSYEVALQQYSTQLAPPMLRLQLHAPARAPSSHLGLLSACMAALSALSVHHSAYIAAYQSDGRALRPRPLLRVGADVGPSGSHALHRHRLWIRIHTHLCRPFTPRATPAEYAAAWRRSARLDALGSIRCTWPRCQSVAARQAECVVKGGRGRSCNAMRGDRRAPGWKQSLQARE